MLYNISPQARYRNKHRAKGLCQDCSRIALVGHSRCAIHNNRNAVNSKEPNKKRRKQWKAEGRCSRCGTSLIESEGAYCVNCNIETNVLRKGRI